MGRLDRFRKEAGFTAGAKVVSLLFIIGMVLLLVVQPSDMPAEHATASASAFAAGPAH